MASEGEDGKVVVGGNGRDDGARSFEGRNFRRKTFLIFFVTG